MWRSSDSLKIPRLKTILESLAPMFAVRGQASSEQTPKSHAYQNGWQRQVAGRGRSSTCPYGGQVLTVHELPVGLLSNYSLAGVNKRRR